MGQNKLQRFEEIKHLPNVLEHPENMRGNWNTHFKNNNPIILELACGKGEYAVALAKMYPQKNFIGVDIKGNRLWKGATIALQQSINNVAFLRIPIDNVTEYFEAGEVYEIWITFPDPQVRFSKGKKRLTHPKFLRLYKSILQPGGKVHLKTDSPLLYNFTKDVIDLFNLPLLIDINDVYASKETSPELQIKTYYESLDIAGSKKVHYLQFTVEPELSVDKDVILKNKQREQYFG